MNGRQDEQLQGGSIGHSQNLQYPAGFRQTTELPQARQSGSRRNLFMAEWAKLGFRPESLTLFPPRQPTPEPQASRKRSREASCLDDDNESSGVKRRCSRSASPDISAQGITDDSEDSDESDEQLQGGSIGHSQNLQYPVGFQQTTELPQARQSGSRGNLFTAEWAKLGFLPELLTLFPPRQPTPEPQASRKRSREASCLDDEDESSGVKRRCSKSASPVISAQRATDDSKDSEDSDESDESDDDEIRRLFKAGWAKLGFLPKTLTQSQPHQPSPEPQVSRKRSRETLCLDNEDQFSGAKRQCGRRAEWEKSARQVVSEPPVVLGAPIAPEAHMVPKAPKSRGDVKKSSDTNVPELMKWGREHLGLDDTGLDAEPTFPLQETEQASTGIAVLSSGVTSRRFPSTTQIQETPSQQHTAPRHFFQLPASKKKRPYRALVLDVRP